MPSAAQLSVLPELARVTAHDSRRAQGVMFLLDRPDGIVASAIEFLSLAVQLDERRAVPFPEVVHGRLATLLREQDALDWPALRSGAIVI
jgi:hypothetical protein